MEILLQKAPYDLWKSLNFQAYFFIFLFIKTFL